MDLRDGYAELQGAAERGAAALEQKHLLAWLPLVKRITRQLSSQIGGAIDREDMEQIGLMGLLEALRRYGEPDAKFASFAALRVRGSILDELRRQDWRPRSVRQDSHKLRDAERALTRRLGHAPSEAELQSELQITADELQEHRLAENAELLVSFDEIVEELHRLPSQSQSPEAALMTRRSIEQALAVLDAREQRVVQLYYEFDLSLKEIAAVLGLTDARVCQINKGALRKMKDFLKEA
ncbi:DNA-directed RNA polymerase sigma-70 factor [Pseudorhodoferax aquiterrae]|uniref:DNA-directed RNA polymerase sigma-70 factor n=1 Tax=Pseudorhodoferax aquiterrae TaxID=747304 RepID=A0ABQ3GFU4_9BURK|nr:FliA/WhiG family RNA polymerase sigma factor [Pseudorhodoferax aquiterrae]GHD03307.1 DNA-directed RNA polymerase sigma-70 factor [Pseudorhodoferax aquiterrae]